MPADPVSDDAELVQRVLAGETAGFTPLVTRHRDRLFRFLLRRVGDRQAAEDLAQDTFVEAFRKLHTFRGESKLSTWLLGIALNRARNYVNRDRVKALRHQPLESLAEQRDTERNPSEVTTDKVMLAALRQAIDGLDEELREVLTLVAMEGQSYDEAARIMEIPVGTVKSRVFKARATLREAMKKHGLDDGSR